MDSNLKAAEEQPVHPIRGLHIDQAGFDAGNKVKGKKRHIAVDTLGLLLGLIVMPANIQDRDVIATLTKMAPPFIQAWPKSLPMVVIKVRKPPPR